MLTTDTVPEKPLVTYASGKDGWSATADGDVPTRTVTITFVARSITPRWPVPELTTYKCVPAAFTATPSGLRPTVNWPTTALVAVSIADTVRENWFVT